MFYSLSFLIRTLPASYASDITETFFWTTVKWLYLVTSKMLDIERCEVMVKIQLRTSERKMIERNLILTPPTTHKLAVNVNTCKKDP